MSSLWVLLLTSIVILGSAAFRWDELTMKGWWFFLAWVLGFSCGWLFEALKRFQSSRG